MLTTTDSPELTNTISSTLLELRLAACVQVVEANSRYRWEGETRQESEQLLIIKCRTDDYAQIEAAIAEMHTYDEPEIVQLAISNGSPGYLQWMADQTAR